MAVRAGGDEYAAVLSRWRWTGRTGDGGARRTGHESSFAAALSGRIPRGTAGFGTRGIVVP